MNTRRTQARRTDRDGGASRSFLVLTFDEQWGLGGLQTAGVVVVRSPPSSVRDPRLRDPSTRRGRPGGDHPLDGRDDRSRKGTGPVRNAFRVSPASFRRMSSTSTSPPPAPKSVEIRRRRGVKDHPELSNITRSPCQRSAGTSVKDEPELCQRSGGAGIPEISLVVMRQLCARLEQQSIEGFPASN